MTTTLRDDLPAKAGRSSCGFCGAGQGQPPGKCRDRRSRRKGTYYGAVPALTLAVAMAHAVPGEGLFDPGEAMGLPPAAGRRLFPR